MEEQEKFDIREHLIGWIDHFLEGGIVPQVVNPKAIRANYILKSKVEEKIDEVNNSNGYSPVNKIFIEQVLQELMEG